MKNLYILKTNKNEINEFYEKGWWTVENTVSLIVRKDNGKLIQIFGSKSDYFNTYKDESLCLIADQSRKTIGYGKAVCNKVNLFDKMSGYYIFK